MEGTRLKDIFKMITILTLSTITSLIFKELNISEANIVTVFILGVLITSKLTDGYMYGIMASALGVILFNFFFTEPYYSLVVYGADYPITFLIMFAAAITTSTTTIKVKREYKRSIERENRINMLYKNSKELLEAKDAEEIVMSSGRNLFHILKTDVYIECTCGDKMIKRYFGDDQELKFSCESEIEAKSYCYENKKSTGNGTLYFSDLKSFYIPICGKDEVRGVIGISVANDDSSIQNLKIITKSVSNQIGVSIDRELLMEKQKSISINIEKERLKANILRSISHDLKTPLTGISGSVALMMEEPSLDKVTVNELLGNIKTNSDWLIKSIENILSLTRIDDEGFTLNKNLEVFEEIVEDVLSLRKKELESVIVDVSIPEEPVLIRIDGNLIKKVILNLLDNSLQHSEEVSHINIKVLSNTKEITVLVEDDGKGISESDLEKIFQRFFTALDSKKSNKDIKGVGLGLSISKSIIEAHGGEIKAYNNNQGGATFMFKLPVNEGDESVG